MSLQSIYFPLYFSCLFLSWPNLSFDGFDGIITSKVSVKGQSISFSCVSHVCVLRPMSLLSVWEEDIVSMKVRQGYSCFCPSRIISALLLCSANYIKLIKYKQFICSLCTIGRFERDETIKVAFQGHVGFVNRHVVAYTSLKYEAWRVIWIFQITQTGIQQGDKLKSVCVYIFRSWIFDGGRVTTPNQLSSFIVGILSPTKLNLKIVLLVISHHTMLF